jgi:hypothetical protein
MKHVSITGVMTALLAVLSLSSCRKEIDNPPYKEIPESAKLDVTELRALYQGTAIHFGDGDTNLYCLVTADEVSGNLYKNVYVTDGQSGLNVRITASGGLYEGDSIRINLNGAILSEYNGILQLDSVDVNKSVVKLKSGNHVTPVDVTMAQVLTDPSLESRLVRISNVEFSYMDVGNTFADATNQLSKNITLLECSGSSIIMRTSGYSKFAGETVPAGNGTVTAILGRYNADLQLYLRRTTDIVLPNPSCQPTVYASKNFEDQNITSGGWSVQLVNGSVSWTANTQGAVFGSAYGQISNYIGGANSACETWLISPTMNLTGATAPTLSFQNAYNYAGTPLSVWVSTNYDGFSAPSTATWVQISPTLSTGAWSWVSSGDISLLSFLSSNVHVAFKYVGTSTNGSTWEIDDIIVKD